jgi:hypothetical protein
MMTKRYADYGRQPKNLAHVKNGQSGAPVVWVANQSAAEALMDETIPRKQFK